MQQFNKILNFEVTKPQYDKVKPKSYESVFKDYDDRVEILSLCELHTLLTRNGINFESPS